MTGDIEMLLSFAARPEAWVDRVMPSVHCVTPFVEPLPGWWDRDAEHELHRLSVSAWAERTSNLSTMTASGGAAAKRRRSNASTAGATQGKRQLSILRFAGSSAGA